MTLRSFKIEESHGTFDKKWKKMIVIIGLKKVVTPLNESEEKPIIINDIRSACSKNNYK
jgi:hypothetical protein